MTPQIDFSALVARVELRPDPERGELYVGFRAGTTLTVYRLHMTSLDQFRLIQVEGNRFISDEPIRQAAIEFLCEWIMKEHQLNLRDLVEAMAGEESLQFWRLTSLIHAIERQRSWYMMFLAHYQDEPEIGHELFMLGTSYFLAMQSEPPKE